MQNPTTVQFDTDRAKVISCPEGFHPEPSVPFLYVLCDALSPGAPIYIGEYGKAKGYNAIERVRRHFARADSSRVNRVRKNMIAFGENIPPTIAAHFFELESRFQNKVERESLEAWVIREFCHVNRTHDERFCVSKYSAPHTNYQYQARSIYALVAACA